MYLSAMVRNPYDEQNPNGYFIIEDSDYNSKQAFRADLKANGYIVKSILDKADIYILNHSNFKTVDDCKKQLAFYRSMRKKYNNPDWDKDIQELEDLIASANKSSLNENKNKIILYHNTSNKNALNINNEGIKAGLRQSEYGKGNEAESSGIWCRNIRTYGNGGATITFEVNETDENLIKQNDTEFILYRDILVNEIKDIDLQVSTIPSNGNHPTVESDIPFAVKKFGKEKVLNVLDNKHFITPYDKEQLEHLIETGNKYCKGKIQMLESKNPAVKEIYKAADGYWVIDLNDGYETSYGTNYIRCKTKKDCLYELENFVSKNEISKIEEASRNTLLAKTKSQTKTRYDKAAGYKGFSIVDIDTTSILTTNSLRVTCKVGDYWDTVQMEDILYWIQLEAEQYSHNQINTKTVTNAIMESIDGMDILVDCTCPDWQYRMAYQATKFGYKFGKPENRPAKITNPNDYGALCKHLTSMLSNKKWLQQVTGTVMDYCEKKIDDINRFLRVKEGEELTLPDELARQNAKKGFWSKFATRQEQIADIADKYMEERADYINNADIFHIKSDLQNFINKNYSGAKIKPNEFDVILTMVTKDKEAEKEPEQTKEEPIKGSETNLERNNEEEENV